MVTKWRKDLHKSPGILEDHTTRKFMATKEGTITKVPSHENDIVNKKYVDDSITAIDLGDLNDVDITGVSNNHLITFNATSGNWENTQSLTLFNMTINNDLIIPNLNIAGFVKNDADGLLSGGNPITSEKTWAFSQTAGAGTTYIGGFYTFNAGVNDFTPGAVNFGATNIALGAHVLFVLQNRIVPGNIILTITGTTITDEGVRTESDTEEVTFISGASVNTYMETTKKFIGLMTIQQLGGTGSANFNYGATKYWDNNNTDFTVKGIDCTWKNGANDSAADIILYHHKPTGWVAGASVPTPPTPIGSMTGDYITETRMYNNQPGAWKRTDFDVDINGDDGEGTIIAVVSNAASGKTFEIGNILVRIESF